MADAVGVANGDQKHGHGGSIDGVQRIEGLVLQIAAGAGPSLLEGGLAHPTPEGGAGNACGLGSLDEGGTAEQGMDGLEFAVGLRIICQRMFLGYRQW